MRTEIDVSKKDVFLLLLTVVVVAALVIGFADVYYPTHKADAVVEQKKEKKATDSAETYSYSGAVETRPSYGNIFRCDASDGPVVISMPKPSGVKMMHFYFRKEDDSPNICRLNLGKGNIILKMQRDSARFDYDGAIHNWDLATSGTAATRDPSKVVEINNLTFELGTPLPAGTRPQ